MPVPQTDTGRRGENPQTSGITYVYKRQAQELDADIIIGTDPDADRLGLVVKDEQDRYFPLTGNQIGVLLLHYILEAKKQKGVLPANGAVVKSLVSTPMAAAIAADYGVELFDVPTGFKFIAEKIQQFQTTGDYTFLFGFEESFGYLSGTKVRDKDAVNAAMLAVETAAYYKQRGMTLYQGLQELYAKYGYFVEKVDSYTLDVYKRQGKTLRTRFSNSLRGSITIRLHPQQRILMSAPTRMISQRSLPQGWLFFVCTTSCRP